MLNPRDNFINNIFEQKVIFDIRSDLYEKIQRLPLQWFDTRRTGDIMTRVVEDVTNMERVLIDGIEQGLIAALQARHGTALLFVTHDLGVVSKVCQKLSVLYAGKVVEDSTVADFFTAPKHPYSAALLAATPKYTDPSAGLQPVPEAVIAAVQAEVAHG